MSSSAPAPLVVLRKDADGRTIGRARVVVRPDAVDDVLALLELAERAGRCVPDGPLLLAEVDGVLRAAAGTDPGDVVADPAFPTALLLELLAERAEEERLSPAARRRRRWRRRWAQWERLWAAGRPGERDLRRLDALRVVGQLRPRRPA